MKHLARLLGSCIVMLLAVSLAMSQNYGHSSIRLTNVGSQTIDFIEKDAWNQLVIGTSSSLTIYDGRQSRTAWQAAEGENLIAFHRSADGEAHYILSDLGLHQNHRLAYDSIHRTISFNSKIHAFLFYENALVVQDDNHIVSKFDLQSGDKIELPFVGGVIRGFCFKDGNLFIFANEVYSWNEKSGAYRDYPMKIPLGEIQIFSDKEKSFLLSESGRLWSLNLSQNNQQSIDRIPISSRIIDGKLIDDELWLLSQHHGIIRFNVLNHVVQYLHATNGLCQNSNSAFYLENDQHIWTAQKLALCLTSNNYPILVNEKRGISDHRITGTAVWNNALYFGSPGSGLYRLSGQQLKSYGKPDGFMATEISALLPLNVDNLFIGTSGSGLFRLDGDGSFHQIDSMKLSGLNITSMTPGVANEIYVGTSDQGLWKATSDSLGEWDARRLHPSSYQSIVDLENLVQESFMNVDVIVAELNQISYFSSRDSRIHQLFSPQNNQQILDIDIWNGWIYAVLSDEIVRLPWSGLEEQIEHFTKENGLRSNSNTAINISNEGVLISDDLGMALYPLDYFHRPSLNQMIKSWPYHMNKNTDAYYDGGEIIGTEQGVVQIDKNNVRAYKTSLVFDEIQINDVVTEQPKSSELSSKENRWGFTYQSIHPEYAGNLNYQWHLQGKRKEFSGKTDQRLLYFPYLPPDQYTLTIEGHGEGVITNKIVQSFCIVPPFTSTKAFLLACLIGGLALIGLLVWITSSIVSRKTKKRLIQQQWHHEKLEWQQKALQLQMNPHFMFNALNSIQSLIGKDDKQARYYTAKLGKLMRLTLHHSRAKWIPINEEIELLQTYLELEKLNRPFQYVVNKMNIEEDIVIPPMMIQPIVENAIKHGVHTMSEGGEVEIKFQYEGRKIKCVVIDNGPGISQDKSDPEHISVSTQVINERMELYAKEGVKVDKIKLIDRSVHGERGTEVQIGLPYNQIRDI